MSMLELSRAIVNLELKVSEIERHLDSLMVLIGHNIEKGKLVEPKADKEKKKEYPI